MVVWEDSLGSSEEEGSSHVCDTKGMARWVLELCLEKLSTLPLKHLQSGHGKICALPQMLILTRAFPWVLSPRMFFLASFLS
jgi:hypothetical protein